MRSESIDQIAAVFFWSLSVLASFSGDRTTMSSGKVSRWTGYFFDDLDVLDKFLAVAHDLKRIRPRNGVQVDAKESFGRALDRVEVESHAVKRACHRTRSIFDGHGGDITGTDLVRLYDDRR
jgi:hypothetical protein